jgi:hypothetical protein
MYVLPRLSVPDTCPAHTGVCPARALVRAAVPRAVELIGSPELCLARRLDRTDGAVFVATWNISYGSSQASTLSVPVRAWQ